MYWWSSREFDALKNVNTATKHEVTKVKNRFLNTIGSRFDNKLGFPKNILLNGDLLVIADLHSRPLFFSSKEPLYMRNVRKDSGFKSLGVFFYLLCLSRAICNSNCLNLPSTNELHLFLLFEWTVQSKWRGSFWQKAQSPLLSLLFQWKMWNHQKR